MAVVNSPGPASLAFLLLVLGGLPALALRSHRAGHLLAAPRSGIYLGSVLSQWFCFLLLVLVLFATGEPFASVGLDRRLPIAETLGWAAATLAAALLVAAAGRALRLRAGQSESPGLEHVLPRTRKEQWLFALLVSPTAGVVEEALFRGFAISRLAALFGSLASGAATALALLLATLAFAAGHTFQGPIGVARVAALGAVLATPYLATGSLWPSVIAHTAYDALGGTALARWLVTRPADA